MGTGRKRWQRLDVTLATALTIHEAGLCSGCGQPRSLSHDPDMTGMFAVRESQCVACEVLDRDRESDRAKHRMPGTKVFVALADRIRGR